MGFGNSLDDIERESMNRYLENLRRGYHDPTRVWAGFTLPPEQIPSEIATYEKTMTDLQNELIELRAEVDELREELLAQANKRGSLLT